MLQVVWLCFVLILKIQRVHIDTKDDAWHRKLSPYYKTQIIFSSVSYSSSLLLEDLEGKSYS